MNSSWCYFSANQNQDIYKNIILTGMKFLPCLLFQQFLALWWLCPTCPLDHRVLGQCKRILYQDHTPTPTQLCIWNRKIFLGQHSSSKLTLKKWSRVMVHISVRMDIIAAWFRAPRFFNPVVGVQFSSPHGSVAVLDVMLTNLHGNDWKRGQDPVRGIN